MSWFGKLTLGSLGMLVGGPLGAIAGAALGHVLIDKKADFITQDPRAIPRSEIEYAEQTQAAFFISLFSILGKLSKIDGVVTRDEIAVVQDFINGLPIDETEKQFARQIFNQAKDSPYRIDDFAAQLYQVVKDQPPLIHSYFDLLFKIVAADGTFHSAEEAALKRVKEIFNIGDKQYEDIKALYFNDLDKHYKMLNCTPESTNEEIKSNYKKLVKDFHPDVIISKGLPEEFIDFASNRFREIQESYQKIRQERNF
ncbi:MAG: TerB family tellurite resistance protein [Deltaproteobacteria bacterium]|jgi:DnaJ like chaperone protein|nr:TerB family tellurite resistance protein [Deltaproteobacteria bacterium]